MHNSPNRGVNYHIFQNKGNYPVILIYGAQEAADTEGTGELDGYVEYETTHDTNGIL